jgi:cytidine deaminase
MGGGRVSAQEASRAVPEVSAAQRELLLARAKEACDKAYAPYSKFHVGAAILTSTGNVYVGVNVENASYGLTNCAERSAIFTAVTSEGPEMKLFAVAVWTDPEGPCSPCGACRQVIHEFGRDCVVYYQGNGTIDEKRASELLPAGFDL